MQVRDPKFDARYDITPEYIAYIRSWKSPITQISPLEEALSMYPLLRKAIGIYDAIFRYCRKK